MTATKSLVRRLGEAVHECGMSPSVSVVLYGSALEAEPGFPPRDIDLWVDGDESTVQSALRRLREMVPVRLDVNSPSRLQTRPERLREASQWTVSQGAVISGFGPTRPNMLWRDVLAAYQEEALTSTVATARDALTLTLGAMPHDAARLNEHAARNLLRGRAMGPREWRASRRLELVELDSVFRSLSPGLASAVAEHGWASPEVAVEVMEAALKYAARI